ncbi:MAG: hypothetical protein Q7Q73_06330 [Verrucomicrobiota bacterium JB024]|nr:hypothetical protein [Verrucomicrobiota bacterium JB024]
MRLIVPTLTALFLLTAFAHAQEEESVSVAFSTLSWKNSIKDLFYFNRGEPVQLFIPNGAPGSVQTYKGPPQMGFYTKRVNAEGETVYDLKASVNITSNASKLLLLFLPSSASPPEQQYRILPLADSDADFPGNTFNFYNLTGANMAIRVGDNKFQLASGRNRLIPLDDVDVQNVDVQMASSTKGSEWTMIYQSRWAPPGKRRAWVFIYGEPGSTPGIRKYYQSVATIMPRAR